MKIGVPKEVKDQELRVAITPDGVKQLTSGGHDVFVEQGAGVGSGFADEEYVKAGAKIGVADQVWKVDLVVKVKEPQESEYSLIKQQMIFAFFHLAGVTKQLTQVLIDSGATAIAYESIEDDSGRLPILEPMSAIAGNMSVLVGAYYLAGFNNGNGMQLGNVLSQSFGKVLVIGDGVVGYHAVRVANGLGAKVTVAGLDEGNWTRQHNKQLPSVKFVHSNYSNIFEYTKEADLVVAAVLNRGGKSPYVVTEEMIREMQVGSVVVDVSIDQGGAIETSKPTTHSNPVFRKHGIIHYCVTNMPGAYPKTSTIALSNVTIPYVKNLADNCANGMNSETRLKQAINIYDGKITVEKIAKTFDLMDFYCQISEIKKIK